MGLYHKPALDKGRGGTARIYGYELAAGKARPAVAGRLIKREVNVTCGRGANRRGQFVNLANVNILMYSCYSGLLADLETPKPKTSILSYGVIDS